MRATRMKKDELLDLLLVTLESEVGSLRVYETTIRCAVDERLNEDWRRFLGRTEHHAELTRRLCEKFDLDPDAESAGRQIVRHRAQALVLAMEMALKTGDADAAQIVGAECVIDAETKNQLNWELLREASKHVEPDLGKTLERAYAEIGEEKLEHLSHTSGWARELSLRALGLNAVLPPPEEIRRVRTVIGARSTRPDDRPSRL